MNNPSTNEPAKPKYATRTKRNIVTVDIPIPEQGEQSMLRIERHGLTILVERDAHRTQENIRSCFAVVAPIEPDRRTHAVRIGGGVFKGKKTGTTLCKENSDGEKPRTGPRIALPLEVVLCAACRRVLVDEGVELREQEL